MQRNVLDAQLADIKQQLQAMGEQVRSALQQALASLQQGDAAQARQVVDGDAGINRMEHELEERCIRLIATQQPVAKDLRKVTAALRIAGELERMADLAVDIARAVIRQQPSPADPVMPDILRMAAVVEEMIRQALVAYVDEDLAAARNLAVLDDEADRLYRGILQELFSRRPDDQGRIAQAMAFAFIGRYLERMGDHATNVGEGVVYIHSGERIDLN